MSRWRHDEGALSDPRGVSAPAAPSSNRAFTYLAPTTQPQLIERAGDEWRIWLNYEPRLIAGTALVLRSSGAIERVTYNHHGRVTHTAVVMPGGLSEAARGLR